jgi:CBS domain containing-hemolysin-like protein
MPWLTAIALGMAAVSSLFRQMAVGVLAATVFLPLAAWFIAPPLGVADKLPYTLFSLMMFVILIFRRLTAQTPAMSTPISLGEKLTNRFLFDRDIRDREAWLNRLSEKHPVSPKSAPVNRK